MRGSLEALDQVLSKKSFLVGNRFSAADICVAYQLYWLPLWPELKPVIDEFPRVVAYIERITTRPAAGATKAFAYQA